ncbi:hypothetical protein KAFR_0C01700 [Kazachstania africana CBS 2517]|uniref:tRNA:m(4)X modification enzyme TRM13 n=1 Tax=Kazachstania africana (strain ATCC 22294 / BCRC 22015 / CBS 2517 / CECT 1963 / NBRC 1671 / NRRL Y-8276) TaxID=1071382 RepID=H2AS13_KAZAF|nr:hypothetical protein KAFR_0C01700 [Kazachstania africana CBS 2517]CCF57163.1 hypothetical protein KAFR_0C01700 [Kazachstania africana CBS 2517]
MTDQPATKKVKHERLQCEYFVTKKNRRCGMTRSKEAKYCSEHINLLKKQEGHNLHNKPDDERIPCPYDPNHTVWKYKLKKHLPKCNKFKLDHVNDNKSFFVENLNTVNVPMKAPIDFNQSLSNTIELIKKIQLNYDIQFSQLSNETMSNTRLMELTNQKHAIQQSSLIENLLTENKSILENTKTLSIAEFGCGKAEFSRYLNQVILAKNNTNPLNFVFIDRGSNRLKFDTKIKLDTLQLTKSQPIIKRLKIDIKDLKIDEILDVSHNHAIISKHLCGVATDLTLKCIFNNPILKKSINAICIAMCCRHVCNAHDYINPSYIKDLMSSHETGLSYEEFFYCLTKMCSWATSGRSPGAEDDDIIKMADDTINITVAEREELGLKARKIVDLGRLKWVQQNLHQNAKLINYVTKDVSMENVALITQDS